MDVLLGRQAAGGGGERDDARDALDKDLASFLPHVRLAPRASSPPSLREKWLMVMMMRGRIGASRRDSCACSQLPEETVAYFLRRGGGEPAGRRAVLAASLAAEVVALDTVESALAVERARIPGTKDGDAVPLTVTGVAEALRSAGVPAAKPAIVPRTSHRGR